MIRWEQQESGDWHGFSGELPVATVPKARMPSGSNEDPRTQAPEGLAQAHRASHDMAGRTPLLADAYWEKWLAAASLRPDLQRLAMQSLPHEERPKAGRRKSTLALGASK